MRRERLASLAVPARRGIQPPGGVCAPHPARSVPGASSPQGAPARGLWPPHASLVPHGIIGLLPGMVCASASPGPALGGSRPRSSAPGHACHGDSRPHDRDVMVYQPRCATSRVECGTLLGSRLDTYPVRYPACHRQAVPGPPRRGSCPPCRPGSPLSRASGMYLS